MNQFLTTTTATEVNGTVRTMLALEICDVAEELASVGRRSTLSRFI